MSPRIAYVSPHIVIVLLYIIIASPRIINVLPYIVIASPRIVIAVAKAVRTSANDKTHALKDF